MRIYIIHEDVAYEHGQVLDVCSSRNKAIVTALRLLNPTEEHTVKPEDLSIEVWEFGRYIHTLGIDFEGCKYKEGAWEFKIK